MARRFRTSGEGAEPMTFSATMRPTAVRIAKKVDFYLLPRPIQDRFVAATRRTAPPTPVLYQKPPRTMVWALPRGSGVVALLALALLRAGWGDVTSPMALHGVKLVVLDVLLWRRPRTASSTPWPSCGRSIRCPTRPGTYLFPACLVEALGPVLRVWAVVDAESVERLATPGAGLELRMRDGSRVTVLARSVDEAERAEKQLTQTRAELARAFAEEEAHVLAELDPLHDSALSSPIGPTEMMKPAVPAWTRFDWGVAAAAGLALGLGLGSARNGVSDDAMYRAVAGSASVPMYEQYLSQGGRHSDEVRDVLLPRAELQAAEAKGTVEAVQAFVQAHPSSKIRPGGRRGPAARDAGGARQGEEARHHRRARRLREEVPGQQPRARAQGGAPRALRPGPRRLEEEGARPTPGRAPSWTASSRGSRRAGAPRARCASACGRRRRSRTRTSRCMKSNHYPGPDALPSKYVTTAAMRAREQRVAADIVQGFAGEIPADVLAVRAADPLAGDAPNPTGVPTLVIDYAPEWSHVNTVSIKPNTVFGGFNFAFDATFVLPEGAPLQLKVKAWRGAELWKMKDEGISREDFQQKVYDAMFDGAFDQLDKKLQDTLF